MNRVVPCFITTPSRVRSWNASGSYIDRHRFPVPVSLVRVDWDLSKSKWSLEQSGYRTGLHSLRFGGRNHSCPFRLRQNRHGFETAPTPRVIGLVAGHEKGRARCVSTVVTGGLKKAAAHRGMNDGRAFFPWATAFFSHKKKPSSIMLKSPPAPSSTWLSEIEAPSHNAEYQALDNRTARIQSRGAPNHASSSQSMQHPHSDSAGTERGLPKLVLQLLLKVITPVAIKLSPYYDDTLIVWGARTLIVTTTLFLILLIIQAFSGLVAVHMLRMGILLLAFVMQLGSTGVTGTAMACSVVYIVVSVHDPCLPPAAPRLPPATPWLPPAATRSYPPAAVPRAPNSCPHTLRRFNRALTSLKPSTITAAVCVGCSICSPAPPPSTRSITASSTSLRRCLTAWSQPRITGHPHYFDGRCDR